MTSLGKPQTGGSLPDRDLVLDIRGLRVDYGFGDDPVHVLKGVDLEVRRGEVLGLAGESGCGKSTLAYAATRLLPPPGLITGGSVQFTGSDGRSFDLLSLSDRELQSTRWSDTAIVFQGAMNSLNPVTRIGDQIIDGILAHRPQIGRVAAMERARELLDTVGIARDRVNDYPHQLSGGMRQRAMIAMALALDPQLLIMDEPTTALDVVMQRQIIARIMELKKDRGFSIIMITHDVSLLIEIADRIAIMYAGEIVEQAPAAEIYRRPRHPYSRALLASFPPLRGPRRELTGIPGAPPDLARPSTGCPFAPRCTYAFDRCLEQRPVLQVPRVGGQAEDRIVACHLHDEDEADRLPADLSVLAR
ncbi:ABC transporter ATP-binding protein [Actinomyces urogenitalis]|uniref:ABC transporter ATP-binding protein n=1 Tax=Actinomyces urogenitalis TaxID=103621 RepID=UPI0024321562|nr:ABC transporter ATP-binding protein [Actinomyces urogenitalis]MCI7456081.1 ABC transporter ATP-binding protein [Actinomyces urogenitalis]